MEAEKIGVGHFIDFKYYHQECYRIFVEEKDYDKLEEFNILCQILEEFRKEKNYNLTIVLEMYILSIKRTAYTMLDLCEQYGYSTLEENDNIEQYCNVILSL